MKTGTLAIGLTMTLAVLGACSSADGDEPSSAPTTTSSSEAGSPSAPASPALRMRGDGGGQWTSCVPYRQSDGDFIWTGTMLKADADASLDRVSSPGSHGVRVVGTWVAESSGGGGAFVPWDKADDFLRRVDWAHRTQVQGAELSAGKRYQVVLRLRPKVDQLPAELHTLVVDYEADGSAGSLTNDTILQFGRHC